MDIGSLTGQVALEDQLSSSLTLMAGKVKSFAEDFDGMVGAVAIGGAAIAAAVVGATISIVALGEEGSKILGVENAFDKLAEAAGTTGDALRGSLMEGVKGTVDDMDLMQSTAKLLGSGMQLTADQALLMGSAARELGKATGQDATAGLDMMSQALVTGRVRGLQQQIGLIDLAAGQQKFADSLGVTVGELNAAGQLEGKRIAILDATQAYLDRLGVSELSFAEKVKQGWVAIDEWGDSLAKSVASSKDVNEALDTVGAAISKAFGGESQTLMDAIVSGINAFARGVTAAVPYVVSFGEGVKSVWNFLADHMGVIVDTTKVVGAFGGAWLVWGAGGALVTGIVGGFTAITASITAVTVAIAANPLGALAVASVAAGLAISHFAQSSADAAVATQVAGAQQDVMNKAILAGDAALKGLAPSAENAAAAKKYLADVGKIVGDGLQTENEKLNDNSEFLKDNKAAVGTLIDTILGEGKALKTVQEAFTQLYDSGQLYGDTLLRIQPELDKLTKAHIALSPAQKEVYQDSINLTQTLNELDRETLTANNVTLEYITTQKSYGLTMQNIASLLGVTVTSLTTYESTLRMVRSFEAESLKTSQQLWNEWASIIEADLVTTTFDKGRLAIQNWKRDQMDALDAWVKKEKESYPEQTERITNEYENRLAAYKAIEQAKLDQLDKDTQRADNTTKAYYDRQAQEATNTYNLIKTGITGASDATIEAARINANALTISAQNWTQWSGAGRSATDTVVEGLHNVVSGLGEVITTTNTTISAFHQLAMATPSGSTGTAQQYAASNIDIFERQGMSAGEAISEFQRTKAVAGYNYGDLWKLEGSLHGYIDGGPVAETGPAIVHAGEYVLTPEMQRNGAFGSGGGDMIQIYVTQPLGTPDAIARAVGNALVTRDRRIGNKQGVGA